VSDPVTYTAVLPIGEDTVRFVSALLGADRRRRRTRPKRRALGCYRRAVLVLRWFLDGTRLAQLAADNGIGSSTAYRYLHEGIDVLADRAPRLRGALLAARAAGHSHVTVDGTLIRTDRCHPSRPDRPDRPDGCPGGPVVVGQARRPRRQRSGHRRPRRLADLDLGRAARPRARHHRAAHPPRGAAAAGRVDRPDPCGAGRPGLRRRAHGPDHPDQALRRAPADRGRALRQPAARRGQAPAERGHSLLKTSFKALRQVSLCPWRSGAITAAALVLLHHMHDRTT
jgi:hypothetical protein